MTGTFTTTAWSCQMRLVVDDARVLDAAARDLMGLLERVDRVASRFRDDSALSSANAAAGRPHPIPRLLVDLVAAALDAAAATNGAVDPTLGLAMRRAGYDRDIAELRRLGDIAELRRLGDIPELRRLGDVAEPVPDTLLPGRWRAVALHREAGLLTVPTGCALDLGATAKAWTADRAADSIAARFGTGVLIELGGDIAVAGERTGGWVVRVAERADGPAQQIRLHRGGLTTSTTTVRTWQRGGRAMHHILDPATGRPADARWRTASVAASSALAANTASTAAVVLGEAAVPWLHAQRVAARLIGRDGELLTLGGWPRPELAGAA